MEMADRTEDNNCDCSAELKEMNGKDVTVDTLLPENSESVHVTKQLLYNVEENPGFILNILLGFQQYFTMFGGAIIIPFVLSEVMCFSSQQIVIAEVMNTLFFIYGFSTVLQVTLGVRLPILQGGSFTFIGPTTAILSLPEYRCTNALVRSTNQSFVGNWNGTTSTNLTDMINNETIQDDWRLRMNLICGSLMVASLFQVIVGFSGIIGLLLRFVGPLTTATVISLVGIHIYPLAAEKAGKNWIISSITVLLVLLFTLYLTEVPVPLPHYTRKKGYKIIWFKGFKLFPVILAVATSWGLCGILTAANAFTDDPNDPAYSSRTDARLPVVKEAPWIRVPYPGQWGTPSVTVAAVLGTIAGIIPSIIESVGHYYVCARLSGAPPPPKHAINRGIGMEGVCCVLAGALGGGIGVTSFSQNVAAIGITRVGSRSVFLSTGIIMLIFGTLGKFGAFVSTIPAPVVGGVFIVLFGLITSVGIANLQFVDLNSTRNLTIFGCSLIIGMGIPYWIKSHQYIISTGQKEFDQILTVLLTTEITVGGLVSAILDNTAPGTPKERGLTYFQDLNQDQSDTSHPGGPSIHVYHFPSPIQKILNRVKVVKYFPFLPNYQMKKKDSKV